MVSENTLQMHSEACICAQRAVASWRHNGFADHMFLAENSTAGAGVWNSA